ncbi:peptidoglycan DD-metalloendopeptidase family protein [Nostocoides sp. HKS02]|nr:peptidoglycan DD-metalloendopeptidase family protein [Tetrasphaera sp. HKS02]
MSFGSALVGSASFGSASVGAASVGRSASASPASQPPVRPTGAVPVGRWAWPLVPRPVVLRPFDPPASAYGSGHRGIDLAGRDGQQVRAVAAGTVSHVGVLGGRGTVTVLHPSGVRSTYEPVRGLVTRGQVVAAGEVIGTLTTTGSHCAPDPCLHLGAIRDERYLDPLALVGAGQGAAASPRLNHPHEAAWASGRAASPPVGRVGHSADFTRAGGPDGRTA